jgi:hypothetical protein
MKNLSFSFPSRLVPRTTVKLSVLLGICLLTAGCFPYPGFEGRAPHVVEVLSQNSLSPGDSIEIGFSCAMDQGSLDSALLFSGEKGNFGGTIEWTTPERLLFNPEEVELSREYQLTISTLARSREGIPMAAVFSHSFFTGVDRTAPEVIEISPEPAPGEPIQAPLELKILFSRSMNRESFYRAFSLSPDIGGSFAWNHDDRELIFTSPFAPEEDTVLRLDLSRECVDLNGQALHKAQLRFFTLAAPARPCLEEIRLYSEFGSRIETVTETGFLSFDHDESMELIFDQLEGITEEDYRIYFQPSLDFETESTGDPRTIRLVFEGPPRFGEEYLLTAWDSQVLLRCDGSRSILPTLTGVAFCPDTASGSFDFQRILPNDVIFPEESESACLEIAFSHSHEASISLPKIMENLSLRFTNGCAFFSPLSLVLENTPACEELADLNPQTVAHYYFSLSPQAVPGLMQLELAAGLEDSFGNRIAEGILLSYNL